MPKKFKKDPGRFVVVVFFVIIIPTLVLDLDFDSTWTSTWTRVWQLCLLPDGHPSNYEHELLGSSGIRCIQHTMALGVTVNDKK